MFGHDDTAPTKEVTALPPTDNATATTDAPSAPAINDVSATSPADSAGPFIATDQSGAPDASLPAPALDDSDGLLNIKQQALKQLSPLVGHLNQTPEEKFRTTMMMIQASDDQSLIKDAYEAAKGITDEKTRAQALLDIINEINYFTSQQADAA